MKIYILVDNSSSWIMPYANILATNLIDKRHEVSLVSHQDDILQCDIAFYLGCVSIVKKKIMDRSDSRIVVHPSLLPQGRGFSPLAWQILEGKNIIKVVSASNLKTRLGLVLDALNRPQPVSDSILTPSIKIEVEFS